MKKKKLLSISILCFTITFASVGVFAADSALSDAQKSILKGIIKTYYTGEKPINDLNINKDTKIGDIINKDSEYYKKIESELNSTDQGKIISKYITDGASISDILSTSLIYASLNKENFNSYKIMTTEVTNVLLDIASTTDPAERASKEEKAAEMINPEYGALKFGKNSEGNTTLSLEKENQIILQINSASASKLVGILNSFNTYDEFCAYLTELGIK
ncbi:hypothetical protein GKZ28_19510 [Clostridium chromiireducens]|uniref:DUF1002 domain-containing protein n=1 Tax=Clostridium chromiireducens TaxID=225345 RepID=A0A964RQD1_9CLOT|nr:hypothetical protein [Clostridium chromiireducens]MVX65869.1 hypothetical protein [Clostridium chromiireducens]